MTKIGGNELDRNRIKRNRTTQRINPLNAELNPICHLLALLGVATIVVVSRLRVKQTGENIWPVE